LVPELAQEWVQEWVQKWENQWVPLPLPLKEMQSALPLKEWAQWSVPD
jgi:hypothetical protein